MQQHRSRNRKHPLKTRVPIVTVVDKSQKYKIKVKEEPDPAMAGAIVEPMTGNFL